MITVKIPEAKLRAFNNDVHAGCYVRSALAAAGIPSNGTLGPIYLGAGALTQTVVVEPNDDTFEDERFYVYTWEGA